MSDASTWNPSTPPLRNLDSYLSPGPEGSDIARRGDWLDCHVLEVIKQLDILPLELPDNAVDLNMAPYGLPQFGPSVFVMRECSSNH
jgi:hypothetical protein